MNIPKQDVRDLTPEELKKVITARGEKAFRATQVFNWVQAKAVQNWSEMKNISPATQENLAEALELVPLRLLQERISNDGTRKYLWGLADKQAVESVLLHHSGDITKTRNTLCISTQVGCVMGCNFCATGKLGFTRNLSASEIVGQVLDITYRRRLEQNDFKINNLVYMGMGEPLLNLPAVLKSIKLLNDVQGQNIGIRRITVSTCGIVPKILELAHLNLDIVLAVSLHASNNELRSSIMPVNRKYPLEQLMAACKEYVKVTGRRITFEYALVKNFNDSRELARELAQLLNGLAANINIIPVNDGGHDYIKPTAREVKSFVRILTSFGLDAVVREEKGSDIEAACGQLAGSYSSEQK